MEEISLKKVRKEGKELVAPSTLPKEMYPSFNIYENPPKALMAWRKRVSVWPATGAKIRGGSISTSRILSIGHLIISVVPRRLREQ